MSNSATSTISEQATLSAGDSQSIHFRPGQPGNVSVHSVPSPSFAHTETGLLAEVFLRRPGSTTPVATAKFKVPSPSIGLGYDATAAELAIAGEWTCEIVNASLDAINFATGVTFPIAGPRVINLTGVWQADDGGQYYLRQIDNILWWAGLSQDGAIYNGLTFSNFYRGTLQVGKEVIIRGEWSDVPRGQTTNHGTLSLLFIDGDVPAQRLQKVDFTGPFGGSLWQRGTWPAGRLPADVLFGQVLKNIVANWHITEKSTLKDNLFFLKDSVSVFGQIQAPPQVNYPYDAGRSYNDFICLNSPSFLGLGDQIDGDVYFDIKVDVDQINTGQPDFFAGMSHIQLVQSELQNNTHAEIIMFGKSADCGDTGNNEAPSLFPGWGEAGGNAVLFNGQPIAIFDPADQTSFLNDLLTVGDFVRVTGVMVFDVGHGEDFDDPNHLPGLEIHPVYAVDKIAPAGTADLSGAWADDIGNTFYLRHYQDTNAIWYMCLSPLGAQAFGHVYHGTLDIQTSTIKGTMAALDFGFGASPSPLGDAGIVSFVVDPAKITLTAKGVRLRKLRDKPLFFRQISVPSLIEFPPAPRKQPSAPKAAVITNVGTLPATVGIPPWPLPHPEAFAWNRGGGYLRTQPGRKLGGRSHVHSVSTRRKRRRASDHQ
jgi:hypothetical protein